MDFSIFDSFDMSVFAFFGEQIQSATMNIFAEFITFFGGGSFVTPMAIVGALLIPFKKTRKFGMAVLFAVLVYELVGPALTKRSLLAVGEIKPEGKTSARTENQKEHHPFVITKKK